MGAWGTGLYSDDVSDDIRSEYLDKLRRGKTNEQVVKEMIYEYSEIIDDDDDGPIFWFALADTQWNYGRLLPNVLEQAMKYLESKTDLQRWYDESEKLGNSRREVLEKLYNKLTSPQPPEKKVYKYRFYICPWKLGDVFAYQMESDFAKEAGLFGKYLVIQKVDEGFWYPGHTVPIVSVRISKNETIPKIDDINNLEYIKIGMNDGKSKFEYCCKLVITSKRQVPNNLIYMGNVQIVVPNDEFRPLYDVSYTSLYFKAIEERLMRLYIAINLKQRKN